MCEQLSLMPKCLVVTLKQNSASNGGLENPDFSWNGNELKTVGVLTEFGGYFLSSWDGGGHPGVQGSYGQQQNRVRLGHPSGSDPGSGLCKSELKAKIRNGMKLQQNSEWGYSCYRLEISRCF